MPLELQLERVFSRVHVISYENLCALTGAESIPDDLILQRAVLLRRLWVAKSEFLSLDAEIIRIRNHALVHLFENELVHVADL
jgi:hypothetical protein